MVKIRKSNLFVILILILALSLNPCVFAEANTQTEAENYAGNTDVNRVLLIEENLPWNSDANTTVLNKLGMSVTIIDMLDFATIDLTPYYVVIVANDQDLSFYTDYKAVKEKLDKYVEKGGILVMGVCDGGWANGKMTADLPGGVQLASIFYDNYNIIEDYTHPIVTGELTDNVPLKDEDLYSNLCSHREFMEKTLPQGTKVILRAKSTRRPTLIEYPYGAGRVIASGLTWEFSYKNKKSFAVKAMDDYFAYAISLINSTIGYEFRRTIGIEFEQTSQPDSGADVPIINRVSADFDEENNYYTLSITDFTADNNASPFFFWKTNDGYFIDSSDDYKTVKFIPDPGMKGSIAKVTAYIGDNLGYTSQYLIEVEGKRPLSEDGMNVEIISDINNIKAEEVFKIEYNAVNKDGDKIIPGTSVDIFYTPDGENWIQIADGILDKNSFDWQVPAVKSDYAKIRIVAQNGIKIKSAESQVFRITPSYYVTGSVLDLKGTGVPGIKVECSGIETFTDNSGRFILRGLGSGEHVIRVSGDNVLFVKSEASVYLDENNYYSEKTFRVRN